MASPFFSGKSNLAKQSFKGTRNSVIKRIRSPIKKDGKVIKNYHIVSVSENKNARDIDS